MTTTDPVDWENQYAIADTPWDLGRPLPLLTEALAAGLLGEPGTAVALGAGRGHDAAALAAAGWRTTVVDLSTTAAAYAAAHYPDLTYAVGDATSAEFVREQVGSVDLLWDHTFFCAVPREVRSRVAGVISAVVRPGGLLASGVFPLARDRDEPGPPWAYEADDLAALLPEFDLIHLGEPTRIMTHLPWDTRLAIWRRRA